MTLAGPKAPQPHPMATGGAGPTGKAQQCGVKVFPLAIGNEWTYTMVPSPLPPEDAIKRISPPEPNTIVIKVTDIKTDPKTKDTVVTLEEKATIDLTKDQKKPILDERTITTSITCNAKKFEISPDSFFFAGEPGGYVGLKLDSVEHKSTSWVLTNGGIGEGQWREDVAIKWTRLPKEGSQAQLGSGKVELERQFTPQPQESISTKAGAYTAEKLGLITTGRVTLDKTLQPDTKPLEVPANWVTTLWIAPGAGVVQTLNPYQHMYQLSAATLK
ncbi:MAG TPA: hypothetical protein VGC41_01920 [Kofleriaceae bacterium]